MGGKLSFYYITKLHIFIVAMYNGRRVFHEGNIVKEADLKDRRHDFDG